MKTIQVILSGLIGATALTACSTENQKQAEETPVRVEVYAPTLAQENGMFVSGMVSARQTAVISTRVMGFVDKIYVRQGQQVQKGQLLMRLNSDDLNAKKAQAEAMLAEAKAAAQNATRDYERYKVLHAKKSVSDKELENMELNRISIDAKLQMARQAVNEINAMLAYTQIRAPFSGLITQKMIDEGSTANPGMPLLSMEQAGEMEIQASVPENYISHIETGDSVRADIKSLGRQVTGTISEISPSSTLTGGQYSIKIALQPEDKAHLKAGMYAAIHIPGQAPSADKKGIWIEQSSLISRDQLKGVYVVTPENQAMLRWIRTGKVKGSEVEVLSGLNASDRVIRHTDAKLYNGKKVTVNN